MEIDYPLNIAMLSIHSSPLGELGTINTGGMSIYIRELAAEISRCGHTVDIFTCAEHNGHDPIVHIGNNIRLIHFSIPEANTSPIQNLLVFLPKVCRKLKDFTEKEIRHYDIIHSHYWLSGCLGEILQKRWNIPHIIMFHTLGLMKAHPESEEQEPPLRIAHEKRLAAQCQKIIAPTEQEKNNLINKYQAHPDMIDIIPGGVDLDLFQIHNQDKARHCLNRESKAPFILFVGRFAALKGVPLLLETMALLQEKHPVELMIIGGDGTDNPMRQHLKNHTARLNLVKQVHFIGRVEHQKLPLYYSAADLVVMPSHYESFGLVCLEALACGTPVVASHVGVMPGVLDGTGNGLTIVEPDTQTLAETINRFLLKKQSKDYDPESVRASVKTYSWKRVATNTLHVYKKLVCD